MRLALTLPYEHRFCFEATLSDPDESLRKDNASHLKAVFQWIIKNAERTAPQDITLNQYCRLLKMIYKRAPGIMLEEDVVTDVNAVSLQAETVNDH